MSQAAEKALQVLRHVASNNEPVGMMAAADALGLDKSTCSRLLGLLVEQGWLVRDEQSRMFSVGPTLVGLAATAAVGTRMQAILQPILLRLRDKTGETVSFHRWVGARRVCVAGLESQQVVRRVLPLGDSFPLPVGPSGRAILAFVEAERQQEFLRGLDDDEVRRIRSDLESAVRTGAVLTDVEYAPSVGAVSVPVFDRQSVFGSLTVAGPLPRWSHERRAEVAPSVLDTAGVLTVALGGSDEPYRRWQQVWSAHGEAVAAR